MDSLSSGFSNSNFSPLPRGEKPDKNDAGNKNQQTSGAIPKQLKKDPALLFCASAGTTTSGEATDDLFDKRLVSRSTVNSDDEHTLIRHIVDQTKRNGDLSLLWTIIEMSPEILPAREVLPVASRKLDRLTESMHPLLKNTKNVAQNVIKSFHFYQPNTSNK